MVLTDDRASSRGGLRGAVRDGLRWAAAAPPLRWLILALDWLPRKIMWLWGHLRFAALVRDQGRGCICHWGAEIKGPANLSLGDGVIIGTNAVIGAHSPIRIGNNVRISRDVIIETAGLDFAGKSAPYAHISAPIVLEDDAWIGARAMILGGVTVGKGAVVAAGAVVTKDVPAGAVVAGVPAKVVRA